MRRALISSALACVLAACDPGRPTGDPAPLPNYLLKKADFESPRGWYYQGTLLETPPDLDPDGLWTWFPTPMNPVLKLRWEFQEHYLVAYRVNPRFSAGTDSAALAQQAKPELVFPCTHYDVFLDQIVEAPKRAWYEREYAIVDWSASQHGGDALNPHYIEIDEAAFEPERTWVQQPGDADAPRFDFANGYFDVTVRAHLKQSRATSLGISERAQCFDGDTTPCGPRQASWRLAFAQVPESDYQPFQVPFAWATNLFSVFKTGELHFDDKYGFTDEGVLRLGRRFNLWRKSFTAEGAPLPYRQRQMAQKPIYLSPNFPRDLVGETRDAAAQWSDSLRTTADSLRRIECEDEGGGAACAGLPRETTDFFVICENNPVVDGDPALCGPAGTAVRFGDFRHMQIVWSEASGTRHPTAVGFFVTDPESGEAFGGVIVLEGPQIDRGAATTADAINLLNGVPSMASDFYEGRLTAQRVRDARLVTAGQALEATEAGPGLPPGVPPPAVGLSPAEALARYRRVQTGWVTSAARPSGMFPPDQLAAQVDARARPLFDRLTAEATIAEGRRAALRGTSIEQLVTDDEAMLTAGVLPHSPPTEAELELASPLRGRWWDRAPTALDPFAAEPVFTDPDLSDVAPRYRGKPYDDLYAEMRRQQTHQLLLHELGHTLGLRHNFAGSYDALNYPAGYWALRDDGNMAPRYQDPVSPAERAGGIRTLMYSSVMDYLPNFTYLGAGLGRYDKAAIKWLYGDLVEVFDGPKNRNMGKEANDMFQWTRAFAPEPMIAAPDAARKIAHYTDLPRLFDITDRTDFPANRLVNYYGNTAVQSLSAANSTPDGRVMVPYRNCGDELNNLFASCQWLDLGADVYEVVDDAIAREQGYYLFTHFRRGLLGFPYQRSSLLPAQTLTTLSGVAIFATYWMAVLNDPTLFTPQEGLGAIPQGLVRAIDYLGQRITTPDVGGYAYASTGNGGQLFQRLTQQEPPGAATLSLDLGRARHYRSQLLEPLDFGDFWYDQVKVLGYAGDKYAALRLLTEGEPVSQFGLSTSRDPRKAVSAFHRFFEPQVNGWLGSLLAHDYGRFAPSWDGTNLVYAPVSDGAWNPITLRQVDPATPLGVEMNAVAQGLANLHASATTYAFSDSARIWILGSGAAVMTAQKVSFVDAVSGKTYEALSLLDTLGNQAGIGAKMLLHAADLQTRATTASTPALRALAQAELDDYRFLLEMTRLTSETLQRSAK